ncbi:hypothetical protein AAMO2058_000486300 [Amorphochlora amoebiformis]
MRLLRALRRAARPNVHGKAFRFSPTPKHYRMAFVGTVGAGASLLAVMAMPVAHAEEIAADGSSKQIEEPEYTLFQKCLAETIGTGALISIGCGVVGALKYANYPIGPFGVSAVWGATVMLVVYSIGDISGAHINPAITASLAINKPDDFPAEHIPYYVSSQMLGATVASLGTYGLFRHGIQALEVKEGIKRGSVASAQIYNGAFGLIADPKYVRGPGSHLAIEIMATSFLSFFVFALSDEDNTIPKQATPALVGATVMTLVNTFAPLTGCGMNPARDLGPRLVTAVTGWGPVAFKSAWLYTVGPVIGAVLGGATYNAFKPNKRSSA